MSIELNLQQKADIDSDDEYVKWLVYVQGQFLGVVYLVMVPCESQTCPNKCDTKAGCIIYVYV